MPSAEDYAIRDRVFGNAMADANWAADLFIMQDHTERMIMERLDQEKALGEEIENYGKADER